MSESSFSNASLDSPPLSADVDIQIQLQKEADLVLKTLRATKSSHDELLDCETLSLVSNDDDSEHNSASSVNYRTYHKSWGISQNNIPIISSLPLVNKTENLANNLPSEQLIDTCSGEESSLENEHAIAKPKIVKPDENPPEDSRIEESPKAIRGRRKPLYSKSGLSSKIASKTIRPVRNVTSNLVTNVSSNFKPSNIMKPNTNLQARTVISKSASPQGRAASASKAVSQYSSPKTSPARTSATKSSPKKSLSGSGIATKTHPKGIYFNQYQ